MEKSLLILGAGGFGRTVYELAQSCGYTKIAFLDDNAADARVVGDCAAYARFVGQYTDAYPAFGNNKLRLGWLTMLRQAGFALPVLVHPAALVSPRAQVGEGSVVLPFALVNTGAVVGRGCIVNAGAIIDHDAVLENGVHACLHCTVKAGATVPAQTKVEAGTVIKRPDEK